MTDTDDPEFPWTEHANRIARVVRPMVDEDGTSTIQITRYEKLEGVPTKRVEKYTRSLRVALAEAAMEGHTVGHERYQRISWQADFDWQYIAKNISLAKVRKWCKDNGLTCTDTTIFREPSLTVHDPHTMESRGYGKPPSPKLVSEICLGENSAASQFRDLAHSRKITLVDMLLRVME